MRHLLLCFLLLGMLTACASGPPSYEQNIQSAISGGGNVFVRQLDDGVVLLTEWVEDLYTKNSVLRAASKGGDGSARIVNNQIQITPHDLR